MRRDVLIDGYTQYVVAPNDSDVTTDDDGGLYHRDTRHLSKLTTTVDGAALVTRVDDTEQKRSDLVVRHRQSVLEGDGFVQEVTFDNHSSALFSGRVEVAFDADFADVFEVRGYSASTDRKIRMATDARNVRYKYPSSCAPQAWSAATPFALLRALFDLSPTEDGVDIGVTPHIVPESAIDPVIDYWS